MIPYLALAIAASLQTAPTDVAAPRAPAPGESGRRHHSAEVNYPAEALRRREEGRVGFTATVSPEGRITDCRVTQSSGSEALDRATCELMRTRANFRPAHDAQGHPIPDTIHSSINWVLPN